MAILLSLSNADARLEIVGPISPPSTGVGGVAQPFFSVRSESSGLTGHYTTREGLQESIEVGHGPTFFEDTSYDVQVRSLNGLPVELHTRSPAPFKRVRRMLGDATAVAGPLNFRRSVGRFHFDVTVGGAVTMTVTVEVFPTKISYRDDYELMLAEVEQFKRQLALAFLRSTYRKGSSVRETSTLGELLANLRNEADVLGRALRQVERQPSRQLASRIRMVPARHVRRPTPAVVRQIARGAGAGDLVRVRDHLSVRERLTTHGRQETLDTPEHRWLKSQLVDLLVRVSRGRSAVTEAIRTMQKQGYDPARYEQELFELTSLQDQLTVWANLDPLAAASGRPPPSFTSETLQRQPGYRESAQSLYAIRRGLSALGASHDTSVQDLDVLYEMWCFLKVAHVLGDVLGTDRLDLSLAVRTAGLDLRLASGDVSTIQVGSGDPAFEVTYNLRFQEATGHHKPDIVLVVEHGGWPPIIVVFDAKYRVRGDDQTVKRNGMPAPPQEAVDALHRYRDALTRKYAGVRGRPVVKGAALYPVGFQESVTFRRSGLAKALDEVGIGAIPFLPGNTWHLRRFLASIVRSSAEGLAPAGPPFLADVHARALLP